MTLDGSRAHRAGVGLLILAVAAVYANSLRGGFVFDDPLSTVQNPTLRHWSTAFFPPHRQGLTVEGRPLLNASLALNWAVSGAHTWSYHLLNVLIHLGASLALLGILRRVVSDRTAGVIALLWAVHPLQTESVAYVVQRAESMMGLFYFLTLYFFVKYAGARPPSFAKPSAGNPGALDLQPSSGPASGQRPSAPRRSRSTSAILCIFFCWCGMSTKEDMVSAPVIVLLFDRAFISGSFRAAWQRHRRVYHGLFATWLWLALLVVGTGNRGHTSGFGSGIPVALYWPTQPPAIAHYLRLVFWPAPLVFDYGWQENSSLVAVILSSLLLAGLLIAAAIGLIRNRRWAVPLALFFAALAPTSLVAGNRQTSAEHRMYLPLVAVIGLAVIGIEQWARRRGQANRWLTATALLALPLGLAAAMRNRAYRDELTLYRDTRDKLPSNPFNRYNYGKALQEQGDLAAALVEYRATVRLAPGMAVAYDNLGNTLRELGRLDEAETAYRTGVQQDPNLEKLRYNWGLVLLQLGRKAEAADQFNAAVLLKPDDWDARDNLGGVLLDLNQPRDAEEQFRTVLALGHGSVETHFNLGTAYQLEGRTADARAEFETCLKLSPRYGPALRRLEQLK